MSTQIRGNKQIKNITIENDQIVNGTVELNKLKEGSELLKRDGSVAATNNLNLDGHQLKNIGSPVDGSDAVRKSDLDELAAKVSGTLINREIVSGVKDGQNVTFTLANEPTLATEQIFLNGLMLNAGANADYSIQGNVITFTIPPQATDAILANYIVDGIQLNVDVQATLAAFNGRLTTAESELFSTEQAIVELGNDADILAGRVTGAEGDISALEVRTTNIENNVDAVEASISAEEARAMAAETVLAGRATSSENEIVSLKSRMTSAEGDINSLEAADVAMDTRVSNLEDGLQSETTARTSAVNSLTTRVVALENDDNTVDGRLDVLEADVASLETDLASEAATRLANDNTLQSNINAEIANRTAAVAAVQSNLNTQIASVNASVLAEATARATAVSSVQLNLDIAVEDQVSGDTQLGLRIDGVESGLSTEVSARSSADVALGQRINGVQSDLANEVSARQAGDANLQSQIDSLSSGSGAGFEQLQNALSQEILDRQAGDASTLSSANGYTDSKVAALVNSAPAVLDTLSELSNAIGNDPNFAASLAGQIGDAQINLNAEIAAREAADTALQNSINGEISNRQAAISSEASSRSSADSALQNSINNEIGARTNADNAISLRIDGIESTINTEIIDRGQSISAEATARANADTALGLRIDGVQDDLANEVSAEATARANVDTALGLRIDSLDSDLANEVIVRETAITAEADARALAINNVNVTINIETANRTTAVNNEATARANADTALGLRIDGVDSRVDTVVADLAQEAIDRAADVDAEESRAMAAESSLNTRVSALESAPPPVSSLDSLSDVTIANPSNGQVLQYNGVDWVNGSAPSTFSGSYNDLTDKPSLFSGSYADLTNKPTLAFDGTPNTEFASGAVQIGNYSSQEQDANLVVQGTATKGAMYVQGHPDRAGDQDIIFSGNRYGVAGGFQMYGNHSMLFGTGTSALGAQVAVNNEAASRKGLIVRGAASQTANLFEAQNSSGTVLAVINSSGGATVNGFRCNSMSVHDTSNYGGSFPVTMGNSYGGGTYAHAFAGAGDMHSVLIRTDSIRNGLVVYTGSSTLFSSNVNGTYISSPNFESYSLSLLVNNAHANPTNIAKFQQVGVDRVVINKQGNVTATGTGTFNAPTAANQALIAKGAASQTANLFEAQNSSGTALFSIDKDGSVAAGTVPVARVSGLATVATSGSYNDLSNKPSIPSLTGYATESYVDEKVAALVNSAPATLDTLNELATALGNDANFSTTMTNALAAKANSSSLAAVATSGSYNDLSDKPSIPSIDGLASESYVNNAVAGKADSASLATVATSGSYNDLSNKPVVLVPVREVLTSLVDGAKTEFVLSQSPNDIGYIQVFLNGILQSEGEAEDYTIFADPIALTVSVVFNSAPEAGWKLAVFYFV